MCTSLAAIVGARLRHFREGKGWTQADAAQSIGVKPVTYANMEAGRKNPTLRQVAKYAAGFRVDPAELFRVSELCRMPEEYRPCPDCGYDPCGCEDACR